jgi:hypothetical protein
MTKDKPLKRQTQWIGIPRPVQRLDTPTDAQKKQLTQARNRANELRMAQDIEEALRLARFHPTPDELAERESYSRQLRNALVHAPSVPHCRNCKFEFPFVSVHETAYLFGYGVLCSNCRST